MNREIAVSDLAEEQRVHKDVYVDKDIFDAEMDRIYGKAWIYVAHESQIPNAGDFVSALIGTQEVIAVRGKKGEVFVLYNRCPHKGAKVVAENAGNVGKFFRCPYHAWTFDHSGKLLSPPLRNGYEGTCFDSSSPEFSMRKLARVDLYRGFVFASQSVEGPSLKEFLGGVASSFDNLCDRSPEGKVEVAGGVFRVMQNSNWKIFYENLHDTMHALVTHESSVNAAREQYKSLGEGATLPLELHVMEGNGEPYGFWEKLDLKCFDYGHCYMEGIFDPGALDKDPVMREHLLALESAYGKDRAEQILKMNRHNTTVYGSGSPHTVFQQFRVIRPISVNSTMIEIYTFKLKGAPESVFQRAIMYANVINSPSSNVMPDDVEVYRRVQQGNENNGGDWISMHRYAGTDIRNDGETTSINGTSELPMRNQFAAWREYMRDDTGAMGETK